MIALPVTYTAFSLAGLSPLAFIAITQNSYCVFGIRFITVQYVSLDFILNSVDKKEING